MRATWVLTVASDRWSAAASSALLRPWASSRSTSSSRGVSADRSRWTAAVSWPRPANRLDQAAGDGRRQQRVAGADQPDGGDQVLGRDVLEQEPAGPGGQRRVDVVVEVERRQDDHAGSVGVGRPGCGGSPPARPSPASGCPSAPRRAGSAGPRRPPRPRWSPRRPPRCRRRSGSSGSRCGPAPGRRRRRRAAASVTRPPVGIAGAGVTASGSRR